MCQIHGIYVRVQGRAWKNICSDLIHTLRVESRPSHDLQVNFHCKHNQNTESFAAFKHKLYKLQATKSGPVPGAAYLFSCSIFICALLTTLGLKKLLNGMRLPEIVMINREKSNKICHENLGQISHI